MNSFKIWMISGLCCLLIGCSYENSLQKLAKKSLNYEFELHLLDSGMQFFELGDIQKASEIFQNLTNDSDNDHIRRKALYALACTKLILAQNRDQFGDALVLWENWSKLRGSRLGNEDPRMCGPLFQKAVPSCIELSCPKIGHTETESDDADEESEQSPEVSASQKQDNNSQQPSCYRMLNNREKEIRTLKTTNAKMKKDIQILKNQINALEAIHRKIQEKKKEMP